VVYVPYHLHNYTAIYDEEQVTFMELHVGTYICTSRVRSKTAS
jgi:hypothetical protein